MNSTWVHIVAEIIGGSVAGIIVGLGFFRILWWSTRRAMESNNPGALVFSSFIGRSVMMIAFFAVTFFYAPVAGISAAFGFLVARHLTVRSLAPEEP